MVLMDKATKEKLLALIEKKKNKNTRIYNDNREIYRVNGEKRKGIKNRKQGGMFDK